MKVICVDGSNSMMLIPGETYYAFPVGNGSSAFISKFPRKGSNFGCFQMKRFTICEEVGEPLVIEQIEPRFEQEPEQAIIAKPTDDIVQLSLF